MSDKRRSDRTGGYEAPLTALDSTLPPTRLKEMLGAEGAGILVYTHDAELASILKKAAGEQFPIRVVDDWPDLLEHFGKGQGRIVLIDVDALEQSLEKALAVLSERSSWLVTVVAARQKEAQDFMRFWSERKIHRLLIKPAAVGITRLLLESAVSRYMELRDLHDSPDDAHIVVPARRLPAVDKRGSGKVWKIGAGLVVVVLVAAFAMQMIPLDFARHLPSFGGGSDEESTPAMAESAQPVDAESAPAPVAAPPEAAEEPAGQTDANQQVANDSSTRSEPVQPVQETPAPAPEPAAPVDPFAARLVLADAAMSEGRLTEPASDNALSRYLTILEAAPEHAGARAGLERLTSQLFAQAESALLEGDLGRAESLAAAIGRSEIGGSRLQFLQTQITREREARELKAEAARAVAEAQALSSAAEQEAQRRIEASRLAAERSAAEAQRLAEQAAQSEARANEVQGQVEELREQTRQAPSEVESLVALATTRMQQQAVLEPAGDSARDYIGRAAAIDPANADVVRMQQRIAAVMAERARLLLDRGEIEAAQNLAAEARQFGAEPESLVLLNMELERVIESRDNARRISDLYALGLARLNEGRLTVPEGDSAVDYFFRIREMQPGYPALQSLGERIVTGLVVEIRRNASSSQWRQVDEGLELLADVAPQAPVLQTLRESTTRERRQEEFLATPVPASSLELVRSTPVQYPDRALSRGIEGVVNLQFIVNREGLPERIAVVDSDPAGQFEEAAMAAVGSYVFAPFRFDGAVYSRLVRVTIRFEIG